MQRSPLEVSTDGDVIVITPKRSKTRAEKLREAMNDHEIVAEPDALNDICIRVAAGEASKADASVFIERHLRALARR